MIKSLEMNTIIHTVEGTFIVPSDKEAALLYWLKQNAVKAGAQNVIEQHVSDSNYVGRQLISE